MTEEEIAKFVSSESLPLVVDFNHETAQKIFSGEVKSHFLLFSSVAADDHESKVNVKIFLDNLIKFFDYLLASIYIGNQF